MKDPCNEYITSHGDIQENISFSEIQIKTLIILTLRNVRKEFIINYFGLLGGANLNVFLSYPE